MSVREVTIRPGSYHDSIVLMRVQQALLDRPGVTDVAVVMGTAANLAMLEEGGRLPDEAAAARADDLLVVVTAEDADHAAAATAALDDLLRGERSVESDESYRPRSLATAVRLRPDARWLMVSVPGEYAAGVAREGLELGRNVFLYSDNVPVEQEIALKQQAEAAGLLLMGPDCGTAVVNGVGLGFANRVRRGPIGLVAASGTGLQAVMVEIHRRGGGISHALGSGGRDLSDAVGGLTTRQALRLLAADDETRVIVLISKPPSPRVAVELFRLARAAGKPVVINFPGYAAPAPRVENLIFTRGFDECAAAALDALQPANGQDAPPAPSTEGGEGWLRGLYSGGTLAQEARRILSLFLPSLASNLDGSAPAAAAGSAPFRGHLLLDLGEDEYTVGRPHPMIDNGLRLQHLRAAADDPAVRLILLDVVLGDGAHPDPAAELAPAIREAREQAAQAGRPLTVVAVVIGTDEEPQDLERQIMLLREAGAEVERSNARAAIRAGRLLAPALPDRTPPDPAMLGEPLVAINVGLELFAASLEAQGAPVVPVAWRPPAGGDARLMGILARMKQRGSQG